MLKLIHDAGFSVWMQTNSVVSSTVQVKTNRLRDGTLALGELCSTVKLSIQKDTLSFQLSQPYLLPKWMRGEIIQELCR